MNDAAAIPPDDLQRKLTQIETGRNNLMVECRGTMQTFRLRESTYNWRSTKHGTELTFSAYSRKSSEMGKSPFLEVTVLLESEPELGPGAQWIDQPGYTDREGLEFMSLYYQFGHDPFDHFSVRVLDRSSESLVCQITGVVKGVYRIDLVAPFRRDAKLVRDAER